MSRPTVKPSLAVLTGGLLASASAFASTPLVQGYMLSADQAGHPVASADKAKATADGAAGTNDAADRTDGTKPAPAAPRASGKAGTAPAEGKADKGKAMEGKCGEGKCGGAT